MMTTTAVPGTAVPGTAVPGTAGAGRCHVEIGSPVGPLTLAADGGQLTGLYMETRWHPPAPGLLGQPGDLAAEPFASAASQLAAYFAGELTDFELPVRLDGTPFQQRVWNALRGIGYGQTMTYAQLAAEIGRPAASRAVGMANGRNPVSIIVPCHRVIGTDGSLTGYGGGLENKEYLLGLERRALAG